MNTIFQPGINFINRLKYPQKFALIAFLITLFILALMFGVLRGINPEIEVLEKERVGLQHIDSVKNLLQDVERHRGLINGYLHGDKELNQEIIEINRQIRKRIITVNTVNEKYDNVFQISEDFEAISQDLLDLVEKARSLDIEESFKGHTEIVNKILELIIDIGDRSNITLDEEVDTYYIGNSIVFDLPDLTNRIGLVRGVGIGSAAGKEVNKEERRAMVLNASLSEFLLVSINENMERVFEKNPETRERLNRFLQDLNDSTEAFLDISRNEIIEAKTVNIDPTEYFELGTGAIRSAFRLYELETQVMDNLLEDRINNLKALRLFTLLSTLIGLLLLAYVFTSFSIAVVNSVRDLQKKAQKVAGGDLDVSTDIDTNDELKDLSESMNGMIMNLKKLTKKEENVRQIVLGSLETRTTEETMKNIVVNTGKIFNADRCFFVKYDREKDQYRSVESSSVYVSSLEVIDPSGFKLPAETMKPLTDFILAQQKSIAVDDIDKLKVPEKTMEMLKNIGFKSFIISPVLYTGKPIGLLILEKPADRTRGHTQDDIDLLESIAAQTSILFSQSRLRAEIIRLNEELKISLNVEKILREVTTQARKIKIIDEMELYILQQLQSIFDVNKVVHLHQANHHTEWHSVCVRGQTPELMGDIYWITKDEASEITPNNGEVIVVNDIEKEIKNKKLIKVLREREISSFISYPIYRSFPDIPESINLGLTLITNKEPSQWTQEKKDLFKLIMDSLSIIVLETLQRLELEETRKAFIATLAHDMKSPLLAEQKALEYMIADVQKMPPELLAEYMNDIYRTNEEMLKLVNNLVTAFHYESGRAELSKNSENIGELIIDTIQAMQFLAKDRKCEISTEIEENLPLVEVDKIEINRVLTNLLSNAIKHNPEGTQITVSAKMHHKTVLVSVNDNGRGIPADIKQEIFRKYPIKKRKIGSGLGLYITRQIVEAHEGSVWFETEEGKGTTFFFTLPVER